MFAENPQKPSINARPHLTKHDLTVGAWRYLVLQQTSARLTRHRRVIGHFGCFSGRVGWLVGPHEPPFFGPTACPCAKHDVNALCATSLRRDSQRGEHFLQWAFAGAESKGFEPGVERSPRGVPTLRITVRKITGEWRKWYVCTKKRCSGAENWTFRLGKTSFV